MNRTDKLGETSPGSPGWNSPTTPCFFSPVRNNKMLLFSALILILSQGTSGSPRQEKAWLFPHFSDQLVEVVRRGCSLSGLDLELGSNVIQQAVFGIVDQFILLTFFDLLDHEPQLLPDLVMRTAV